MKYFIIACLICFGTLAQPYEKFSKENTKYENLESLKQSYKSNLSNEIFLKKLGETEKDMVTYHELGRTHMGKVIPALMITMPNKNEDKLSILFNCAHHANELISTEHCYDIIYQLVKNKIDHSNYLNYVKIWVVPMVNPDGSELFWRKFMGLGRKNGRNVDLNRNYPFQWHSGHPKASSSSQDHEMYRGESMASENETQAMMRLAESERFVFSVSYHSKGAKILYPYTIENIKNPSDDYPKWFSNQLIKNMKGYQAIKNLYPVDGTDQDYYYFRYGTMAFLLESRLDNPQYRLVDEIMMETESLWQEIIEQTVNGEKILLKITDENKKPLEAEVKINNFKYYNGERFTSNPKNGIYCRMVNERKNYFLTISHDDYETMNIEILSSNIETKKIIMKKKY